jgi:GNAT superfamily N-acetyltransferase
MLEIRAYRPEDRAAVRHVCLETAYIGNPIAAHFTATEALANILTGYYTDHEPESAWVVTNDGRVVGYLLGCVDSRKAPAPELVGFYEIVKGWLWLRPGSAGWCWTMPWDLITDLGVARTKVDYTRYPAHAHIDLLPEARKGATALKLFRLWLDAARARGATGIWGVSVLDNKAATLFHRAMGFRPLGDPWPAMGFRAPSGERMRGQTWVRELAPAPTAASG